MEGLSFQHNGIKYVGVINEELNFQEHCSKCAYAENCPYLHSINDTPGPCYHTPYLYKMHYEKEKK